MPLVYIRSDVSAAAETHSQNYTRMYSFDDATTQIPAYFQKVLDTPITGKHNYSVLGTRYSVLGTRHSTLDTRHSTSLTFFHNKQHSTFISSLIHKNAQSGFFYPFARFFRIWTVCPRLSAAMAERYFFKGDLP